jgi:Rab-GTPase-TBC domain
LQGVAPHFRAEMWPFLLGVYSPNSTTLERTAELTRLKNLYTKLVFICQELEKGINDSKKTQEASIARAKARAGGASAVPPTPEKAPLPGNLAAFAEAHRIIVMDAVRTDLKVQPSDAAAEAAAVQKKSSNYTINNSGSSFQRASNASNNNLTSNNSTTTTSTPVIVPRITVLPVSVGEGLPELMLVDPPQPDPVEAVASGQLPVWRSDLAAGTIEGATHVTPSARRIMMRLVNILSAYAAHDPETGYCQGMSDLAAAFVQLIENDALAFSCFERLMRDARRNFRHDETGIRNQLNKVSSILSDTDPTLHKKLEALGAADCMFAYRMVLVMLRRELPLGEALTLWEVKWALEAGILAETEANNTTMNSTGSGGTGGSSGGGNSGSLVNAAAAAIAAVNITTSSLESSSSASPLASTVASIDAATKAAVAESKANSNTSNNANRTRVGGGAGGGKVPVKALFQGGTTGGGSSSSGNGRQLSTSTSGGGNSGGGNTSSNEKNISTQQQQQQQQQASPDFILQFVAAAVRAQRNKIIYDCTEGDDVLRLFNSVKIDFWTALAQARKQQKAYSQGMAVLQRL